MYGQPNVFCALNVFDICIVSLLPLLKLYCILKIERGFLKPWKLPSLRPWYVHAGSVASNSYNAVDDISCLSDRLNFPVQIFIFSSGDYHKLKLAVSCVSYPWPNTYDYRVTVNCKCSVLDLHIAIK